MLEERIMKKIGINHDFHDIAGHDVPLSVMRNWLDTIEAGVPEEYRDSISFDLLGNSEADYWANFYYNRPENDDELEKRVEIKKRANDQREAAELAEFERLKAKYS